MNVFIVENPITKMILPLIMYIPDVWEVVPILGTVFPLAYRVIKAKEVKTG
jgi:hypothetical protein